MILTRLKQLVGTSQKFLRARFLQWTTPLTTSLPLQTLADLGRSKSELVAENALLRQQRIILKRQVKRPACTKTDRVLLVFLARVVRTWKQALFIVQPETYCVGIGSSSVCIGNAGQRPLPTSRRSPPKPSP